MSPSAGDYTEAKTGFMFNPCRRDVGTHYSAEKTVKGKAGARFYLEVTGLTSGATTMDVKIQVFDEAGDYWHDVHGAAFAQVTTAIGAQTLTVYPGVAETANVSVSDVLGHSVRAVAVIAGSGATDGYIFSVNCDPIP